MSFLNFISSSRFRSWIDSIKSLSISTLLDEPARAFAALFGGVDILFVFLEVLKI